MSTVGPLVYRLLQPRTRWRQVEICKKGFTTTTKNVHNKLIVNNVSSLDIGKSGLRLVHKFNVIQKRFINATFSTAMYTQDVFNLVPTISDFKRYKSHNTYIYPVGNELDDQDISPRKTSVNFSGSEPSFPCVMPNPHVGPEPEYNVMNNGYEVFHSPVPFQLKYGHGVLPELDIAYETWGELNEAKDNVVLVCTGLSASSHAKSHKENLASGWWEKFIGPGCCVDTNKFFVVCANLLGSCYGSTGPSTVNPLTDKPYGATFPVLSVEDMAHVQMLLLDHLDISTLHACVGSSLGGMISLAATVFYPQRIKRMVSISACVRSMPTSIALRYLQRKAIMTDPSWQKGDYYGSKSYPKAGMKMAREIATLTYRSGPEWQQRFGRQRIDSTSDPTLCPHFMIENYLDHQGEQFSTKLDPNSLLYISKAMDLFDLSETFDSLNTAMKRVSCPSMVIGVQSDILFPVWQQREMANALQDSGNETVTYYELNSLYGHDTFLLDINGVGAGVKGFLETDLSNCKRLKKNA